MSEKIDNQMNQEIEGKLSEREKIEAVIRARLPMILVTAWGNYEDLFGESPHGTFRQMGALIELGAVEQLSEYLMCAKAAKKVRKG